MILFVLSFIPTSDQLKLNGVFRTTQISPTTIINLVIQLNINDFSILEDQPIWIISPKNSIAFLLSLGSSPERGYT